VQRLSHALVEAQDQLATEQQQKAAALKSGADAWQFARLMAKTSGRTS
jgi:hypothetical protein